MTTVEQAQDGLATTLRFECEDARADGGQSTCPVAKVSADIEAEVTRADKAPVKVTPAPETARNGVVDEEGTPQAV